MKKTYSSPECVVIGAGCESHLLAGSQDSWADAKQHKFHKEKNPWKQGVWDGKYEHHSPYDE